MHKLLQRQMIRLGLSEDTPPNGEVWQQFLDKICSTYNEMDQDRYLLERSMDISSGEMSELTDKLESAQEIARLGYWTYDRISGQIVWSKQVFDMLGLDRYKPIPSFVELMGHIHDDHRDNLSQLIERAFEEGVEYETEFKMYRMDNTDEYHWFHVIGRPIVLRDQPIVSISGVIMDVTKRKEVEEEVSRLNTQLVTSARRAGMADVATSVLHNVGNILNSANVSLGIIHECVSNELYKKLVLIQSMLEEHKSHLKAYLTKDPKGKLIPEYLCEVLSTLAQNSKVLNEEVLNLKSHLNHIKNITAMQKSISGLSGVYEKTFIPEVIDNAFKMCGNELSKNEIHINKSFSDYIFLNTDKDKLLQILVNLIHNAKDAILMANKSPEERIINVTVIKNDIDKKLDIAIKDSGVGISQDNLTNIFSFGFTTKKTGHGFGLHSSAITARELGGSLTVESPGENQGATFTLTLPLTEMKGSSHVSKREKSKNYSH